MTIDDLKRMFNHPAGDVSLRALRGERSAARHAATVARAVESHDAASSAPAPAGGNVIINNSPPDRRWIRDVLLPTLRREIMRRPDQALGAW